MRNIFRVLALAGAVTVAGCGTEETSVVDIASTTFAPSLGIDLATMTQTPSGLYFKDLVTGAGATVGAGQQVSVFYTGNLPNGTQFDSNVGSTPFTFAVGTGAVIAGFDQGVTGMRVGGRRQIIMPPGLGYGAAGSGPIPGNAILVFTLEVTAVN